ARELGLEGRARFTGFVSDRTRDELLAGSRLAVCASPKEGWGITVIEANAAGTPVVARDAPGLRDSVRHGETGLLVAGDRVEGFAEAIARLLSDDGLSLRMSRAALAWSKQFGWDRAASEMAEAIDQARAGADGPGP
ncbi:MAG: glycosyltransferase family 4 protein, partial [Myxococcota bacterium]